jgi:RNA polymerase sigma factor (sigma-70 family)
VSDVLNERFNKYIHLAVSIARGLSRSGIPVPTTDLIQWGKTGLWDACRRFSGPENEFPHYAKVRIRGQIIDEIRTEFGFVRRASIQPEFRTLLDNDAVDNTGMTEDSLTTRELFRRVLKKMGSLTKREGYILLKYYFEECTQKEIAAKLKISEPRVCQLKTMAVAQLFEMTGINLDDL